LPLPGVLATILTITQYKALLQILYFFVLRLYVGLIHLWALLGNHKARLWVRGRLGWRARLPSFMPSDKVVWFHCASLGEFEQGRPVMEAMKAADPALCIALTFFSPSGYEVRKSYGVADWVGYLPADVGGNAAYFIEAIRPQLAIFVKYDLWLGYLRAAKAVGVPIVLIASNFRKPPALLQSLTRHTYNHLQHVYVQATVNQQSLRQLLPKLSVTVAGDPRFDRVAAIAHSGSPILEIEQWLGRIPCLVAGSTWPADEALLALQLPWLLQHQWKMILVPHEVDENHLRGAEDRFADHTIRWSDLLRGPADANGKSVLIVDTIGLLSRLYRYARMSYVGGGLGKGIHNTLEAAVWGVPVLFGANYSRFREAVGLIEAGAAFSDTHLLNWQPLLEAAHAQSPEYSQSCNAAARFVQENTGATARILASIREEGLWPLPR
jgi:3-deoxy-D-manno-octulosonic-acid transferase